MVVDPRWTENQEVYWAAMHSANELVPALAKIIESEHWREFIQPRGDVHAFDTFAAYCAGWLQLAASAVEALLERSNEKHAAAMVRKAIREGLEPLGPNGGDRKSGDYQGSNATLIIDVQSVKRDSDYRLARLKRDAPELAAEVVEGTISAYAGAVKAGFIKRPGTFRTDDPELAIDSLLKYFTRDRLLAVLNSRSVEGRRLPLVEGVA